jgi:hypothetical protein
MLQAQGQVQNLNQRFPKSPTIPKSEETEILHFFSFLELRILATFRKPDLLVPQMFFARKPVARPVSFDALLYFTCSKSCLFSAIYSLTQPEKSCTCFNKFNVSHSYGMAIHRSFLATKKPSKTSTWMGHQGSPPRAWRSRSVSNT